MHFVSAPYLEQTVGHHRAVQILYYVKGIQKTALSDLSKDEICPTNKNIVVLTVIA